MTDLVVVVLLVIICGAAARYVYKAKKSGAKCIGCSVGEGGCGCGGDGGSCCCHTETRQ